MRIFFAKVSQKQNEESFKTISKELKNLGYDVPEIDIADLYYSAKNSEITDKEKDALVKSFNRVTDAIRKSDMCIFDMSASETFTGFLLQTSLENQKPTIVLSAKDSTPSFLFGLDDQKLLHESYTEKNLKKVLRNAVTVAREKRDKRFNFFISPKLLEFLETTSNSEGITKSKYIRNLIVEHMRNNQS